MNKKRLFEDYINENIDAAYRFAYTYAGNSEDAEDIVNDSVVKAIKAINSLKDTKYIKTWFYKIISNTALTHIKKKKRFVHLECPEAVYASSEDDYSEITFNSIIQNLDVKYRDVLVLRFMENMQLNEIAKILNLNENTVKTRLYTSLKLLKINMEGDEI